jgi:hypothetical protein
MEEFNPATAWKLLELHVQKGNLVVWVAMTIGACFRLTLTISSFYVIFILHPPTLLLNYFCYFFSSTFLNFNTTQHNLMTRIFIFYFSLIVYIFVQNTFLYLPSTIVSHLLFKQDTVWNSQKKVRVICRVEHHRFWRFLATFPSTLQFTHWASSGQGIYTLFCM